MIEISSEDEENFNQAKKSIHMLFETNKHITDRIWGALLMTELIAGFLETGISLEEIKEKFIYVLDALKENGVENEM